MMRLLGGVKSTSTS